MPTFNNIPGDEIIQWASQHLYSLGFTLKNTRPKKVLSTPWSYVARFETSHGAFYLKHIPEPIALEARIIQLLQDSFGASVPIIVGHNPQLHCFLMQDAGIKLRDILYQGFDESLLYRMIDQFTLLQLRVAENVTPLLKLGVPDWRLSKLPELYDEILSKKEVLIADGLSEKDICALKTLSPMVSEHCKKLALYSIKDTLVQPDFNDNNTLIDLTSLDITMIDLGEISISHPFFSLLNCLQQVRKHYGLEEKEDAYLRLKEACLKNFTQDESLENVTAAFAISNKLWVVYGLLASIRLMQACGVETLIAFQPGKLRETVKEWIRASSWME